MTGLPKVQSAITHLSQAMGIARGRNLTVHETVCAVVVTHNRKELLKRCLAALFDQTRPPDEVLVVDNASSDGTSEMVEREFPNTHCVRLSRNTGGAGGFREGVRRAYSRGHNWLWLMDDDVYPDKNALESLLNTKKLLTEELVVLVPVRLWEDGSLAELPAVDYNLRSLLCLPGRERTSVGSVYPDLSLLPPVLEVIDFSFEGPLLPREAVAAVGLPSAQYYIMGDDTDYAIRLKRAGARLVLVASSHIFRMLRPSSNASLPPWKRRHLIRNKLWITRLYGENWATRWLRPWLWGVLILGASVVKGRLVKDWRGFSATVMGVMEGLFTPPPHESMTKHVPSPGIDAGTE